MQKMVFGSTSAGVQSKKRIKTWVIFLWAGFFVLSLSAFQGQALAEKPSQINVALLVDLSGPYAPVVGPYKPGAEDAWENINQVKNGVKGVKVVLNIRDTSGKVDMGLNFYNELINMKPKPIFFHASESPLGEALRERFVEDGIIALQAATVPDLYPPGNTFGIYPLYVEQTAAGIKWLKNNWKEKRNPRVGIITWDTAYGRGGFTQEFYDYAKEIGVDIVDTQLFGIRDVDISTQMMALRSKKADWLVTNILGGGPLAIKKAVKEMGWDINLINTIGGGWGTVRLGPEYFEGDIFVFDNKSFDEEDDPAIRTLMEYFKKNNRTVKDKATFYIIGWRDALIAHYVMETVVDKYGWEGLNADNMRKEMCSLKDFRPMGGLTAPITFSEKRRTPRMERIYITKGGKLLPLTDFFEVPDLRPPQFK